jgi:hydroxyacylglutathione hydrolase
MSLQVKVLPILEDNYVFILRSNNTIAIIDPGVSHEVLNFCHLNNWTPNYIFNTHHHSDHIGGNTELSNYYKIPVYCSKFDFERIPNATNTFPVEEYLPFGDTHFKVIETTGHTNGHISIHFQNEKILFCGDTLFSLGCGRVFEGDYDALYNSLLKIKELDPKTQIYCTHEYTLKNSLFVRMVDPHHPSLFEFCENIELLRKNGTSTIPFSLESQIKYNPFLRTDDTSLQQLHGTMDSKTLFLKLRKMRDTF